VSFSEVFNKTLEEAFPHSDIPDDVKKGPSRWETVFRTEDGADLHLGFSVSTLKDSKGMNRGKILIFQDLTRFKEMEEQVRRAEKLAAIGQLAAGIAHEIRNPLASMSGSIQLLRKELKSSHDSKRLMDIVLRETDRLNVLISEFLLFAQPSHKQRDSMDVKGLIEDTLDLFIHNPEWKKGITLRKSLETGVCLNANPTQLQQIIWNLVVNAVEAMPEGGTLTITSRMVNGFQDIWEKQSPERNQGGKMKSTGTPYAEISIGDTGTGIHPADFNRIFDPFFTTKESGTGLGLAIVYRIVEDYQGNISVKSEPGKGTIFTVRLPLGP
jgi:two-component system sensor histidine kinase PilS (NtrC family)